jgi:hypothetical protein
MFAHDSAFLPFSTDSESTDSKIAEAGFTQTGTTPPSDNPEHFGDYISL